MIKRWRRGVDTPEICLACGEEFMLDTVRTIRLPIKPPHTPFRYKTFGYSCDTDECEEAATKKALLHIDVVNVHINATGAE